MNRKREKLQAYFAGIFDGEGSVGVYGYKQGGNRKYYAVSMHVTMSEPLPILLLAREYPTGCFLRKKNSGFGDRWQYVWQPSGEDKYRFLLEIKPYVIAKREQVALALSFLVLKRRIAAEGRKATDAEYKRFQWFDSMLKDKKIPDNGVNSVNAWPDRSREYRAKLEEVEADQRRFRELLEGVETRHSESVEAMSAPEQDIVQADVQA